MIKDHSDNEKGNLLQPLYGLLFAISSKDLLYASSHNQDSTYHGLCYTNRGAQAGTIIAQWVHHEGSIRRLIPPGVRYIGDFLLVGTDSEHCHHVLNMLLTVCSELGVSTAEDETVEPCKKANILGLEIMENYANTNTTGKRLSKLINH